LLDALKSKMCRLGSSEQSVFSKMRWKHFSFSLL